MYHDRQIKSVRIPSLICPRARRATAAALNGCGCAARFVERLTLDATDTSRATTGRLEGACGFTLIEVLIVVVIIAIAAMTVVPMVSSAASVQIRSAANMIAADLEYAKSMAISRGQRFSVVFDKDTESYSIRNQAGAIIAHPVKKGFNYVIDFRNDSRLNKVDIANVDFDATSEIKFDYLGSPYNGNDNPLNSGVINLQAGGATATITVEPVTGFILSLIHI